MTVSASGTRFDSHFWYVDFRSLSIPCTATITFLPARPVNVAGSTGTQFLPSKRRNPSSLRGNSPDTLSARYCKPGLKASDEDLENDVLLASKRGDDSVRLIGGRRGRNECRRRCHAADHRAVIRPRREWDAERDRSGQGAVVQRHAYAFSDRREVLIRGPRIDSIEQLDGY